jgi:hypothetical protein
VDVTIQEAKAHILQQRERGSSGGGGEGAQSTGKDPCGHEARWRARREQRLHARLKAY